MKTLLVMAMLLISTSTRAEQIILTNNNQAEVLTVLMIMCPSCVLGTISKSAPVKKEEPKKEVPAERNLASETEKVSK